MKTLIISALFLTISSGAHASSSPKCPAGSRTILKCAAADRPTDQVLALNFMDGAVVCSQRGNLTIILSLPETSTPSEQIPVKEILRAGATSYMADMGDVQFSLNRIVTPSKVNAQFEIYAGGVRAARSLSCK